MPAISVDFGGEQIAALSLVKDVCTIGREASCDVHLPSPGVSRTHARLVRSGAGYDIEDLQSSGGTTIDGQSIERQELAEGMVVIIGKYELTYYVADEPPQGIIQQAPAAPAVEEGLPGGDGILSTFSLDEQAIAQNMLKMRAMAAEAREAAKAAKSGVPAAPKKPAAPAPAPVEPEPPAPEPVVAEPEPEPEVAPEPPPVEEPSPKEQPFTRKPTDVVEAVTEEQVEAFAAVETPVAEEPKAEAPPPAAPAPVATVAPLPVPAPAPAPALPMAPLPSSHDPAAALIALAALARVERYKRRNFCIGAGVIFFIMLILLLTRGC